MPEEPSIPHPRDDDDDDVAWALQTAGVQWNRGAPAEAIVWVRRAVDAAINSGNAQRTKELALLASDIAQWIQASAPSAGSLEPAQRADDVDALLDAAGPPPPPRRPELTSLSGEIPIDVDGSDTPGEDDQFVEIGDGDIDDELATLRPPASPPPSADPGAAPAPRPFARVVQDTLSGAADPFATTLQGSTPVAASPVANTADPFATTARLTPPRPRDSSSASPDRASAVDPFASTLVRHEPPPSSPIAEALLDDSGEEGTPDDFVTSARTFGDSEHPPGARLDSVPDTQLEPDDPFDDSDEPTRELVTELAAGLVDEPERDAPDTEEQEAERLEPDTGEREPAAERLEPDTEEREPAAERLEPDTDEQDPDTEQQEADDFADTQIEATDTRGAPMDETAAVVDGVELQTVRGFEDLPPEDQATLAQAASLDTLGVDEEVGHFGAALVTRGSVGIMPAIADVAAAVAGPGDIVFTRGSLEHGVELRVVAMEEQTTVASWQEQHVADALASCPWVADELRDVADRYQALCGALMGPLGDRLDASLRAMVMERLAVRVLESGETLLEAGKPIPGLYIVGAGRIELTEEDVVRDEQGPGDFIFAAEVMAAGMAPRGARAGSGGALLLHAPRAVAHDLMVSVPPLLEILAG